MKTDNWQSVSVIPKGHCSNMYWNKSVQAKKQQKYSTHQFTYAIYNRQALSLLEQINFYLRTYKRQRSELILQKYLEVTLWNGKYNHRLLAAKHAFEEKMLAIKAI